MNSNFKKLNSHRGVTLVEILLVITIMGVLSAMIIPRVRMVNKDRNIREAARIVGSMFANSSNRAIADGRRAGVLIERNRNNSFAGTRLYEMRSVPGFTGDDADAVAWRPPSGTNLNFVARIIRPLQHDEEADPPRRVVRANDKIYFGNQSFGYRITNVREIVNAADSPSFLDLQLETYVNNGVSRTTLPRPAWREVPSNDIAYRLGDSGVDIQTFRIERRPRVVRTSQIELPAGYEIDLRYSGWFGAVDPDTDSYDADLVQFQSGQSDIVVVFDETGGIDSVRHSTGSHIPTSSLQLFVSENDLELDRSSGEDPLIRPSNLWVSVNHLNGGTSIGYNNPLDPAADLDDRAEMRTRIKESQELATNRQDAAQ